MLEDAKENRATNAGCALEGIGAESPTMGILADEELATRRHVRAYAHTHGIRHQGKSRVFFHGICQLAALGVLCKRQLMKVKAHRVTILQGTRRAPFPSYRQEVEG